MTSYRLLQDERGRAWGLFLRAYKAVTEGVERKMAASGPVSLAAFEVLLRLNNHEDGQMRMLDLARSLVVTQSSVSRLIDRMERQQLVVRSPSPVSGRETYASIKPEGRKAFVSAIQVFESAYRDYFARWIPDEEVDSFNRVLELLFTGAKSEGETPD